MKTLTAALLVLALPGPAPAADEATRGDLAKLQGKWTAMAGPNKDVKVVLEFKGKAASATFATAEGQEGTVKGEVKLDDQAKPKTIDWVKFTGPNGQDIPENLGLYELDGDSFKVCNGGPNNPRPTEFKAGDDGAPSLLVFRRQKGEPDDPK